MELPLDLAETIFTEYPGAWLKARLDPGHLPGGAVGGCLDSSHAAFTEVALGYELACLMRASATV